MFLPVTLYPEDHPVDQAQEYCFVPAAVLSQTATLTNTNTKYSHSIVRVSSRN